MKFGTKIIFIFSGFFIIFTFIELFAPQIGLRSKIDVSETIVVGGIAAALLALGFWNLRKRPQLAETKRANGTDADFKLFLGILVGIIIIILSSLLFLNVRIL